VQAFNVAGPVAWNSLLTDIRTTPAVLQLSRRNGKLFCYLNFMTLKDTWFTHFAFYLILYSLVSWSASAVSFYHLIYYYYLIMNVLKTSKVRMLSDVNFVISLEVNTNFM